MRSRVRRRRPISRPDTATSRLRSPGRSGDWRRAPRLSAWLLRRHDPRVSFVERVTAVMEQIRVRRSGALLRSMPLHVVVDAETTCVQCSAAMTSADSFLRWMKFRVFALRWKQVQVLVAVVVSLVIDVVNDLARCQWPADALRDNQSMLQNIAIGRGHRMFRSNEQDDVSVRSNTSTSLPLRATSAAVIRFVEGLIAGSVTESVSAVRSNASVEGRAALSAGGCPHNAFILAVI